MKKGRILTQLTLPLSACFYDPYLPHYIRVNFVFVEQRKNYYDDMICEYVREAEPSLPPTHAIFFENMS